jgi:2-dehydro-3-deoxygluconokinase
MGEPLVQFSPLESGPLRHAGLFDKHAAGAESNVLVGLSRLGHKTALVTKLGMDELSSFILMTLKAEGVDTRWVKRVEGKNCGIYFTQRNYPIPGKNDVVYFRGESAASTISVEDVPEQAVRTSRVFHLSGITPALGSSCLKASMYVSKLAEKYGVPFSFDPNYRRKLWPIERAAPAFRKLAASSDLLFLDETEASIILGKRQDGREPESIVGALAKLGPETIVLKLGAKRGLSALRGGEYLQIPSYSVPVVDIIGAGDAVVSGFLSGMIVGKDTMTCLKWAAASSALVVMGRGDFENLPTPTDLQNFLAAKDAKTEFDPR